MNGKIYCITNMVNGKRYIGQTINLYRWTQHKSRCNSGFSGHLYDSMRKYGINNFRFDYLVEGIDSIETLNCLELFTIDMFRSMNRQFGYNKTEGGNNGIHSEEVRKKISASNKGKVFTADHKRKLSLAKLNHVPWNSGIPCDENTKLKISSANKGKFAWNKGTKGVVNAPSTSFKSGHIPHHKGTKGVMKSNSTSFKKGMTTWNKGKSHSEETKRKISETKKLKKAA